MSSHVAFIVCAFLLAVVATGAFIVTSDRLARRRGRPGGAHRRGDVPFKDRGDEADPDGSGFVADLRGEPNRFPSLLAGEPEPVPVPEVAPEPQALEPLPEMAVREVSAMPARRAAGMDMPAWSGPAMTDRATGTRTPLEADRMAGLLAAIRAWTPQPAVPQEPPTLAELVQAAPPAAPEPATAPVAAADETGELAFAPVMELGDVDEFVRRTFAEADAGVAAIVAEVLGSRDGEPHFAGASLTGLPEGGWNWSAPLSLPGGYRKATGAGSDDAA